MEFNIEFGKFCLSCGGKCCDGAYWWFEDIDTGKKREPWKGDLRHIKQEIGIDLVIRNDHGLRCMSFSKTKTCEIYDKRPYVCRDYVCDDAVFGSLEANL
jgi:Fe-S-cluster containining protein